MKYLFTFIFSFLCSARRWVPPLNTQCPQNSAESGERWVLIRGSLCLPCWVRDTGEAEKKKKRTLSTYNYLVAARISFAFLDLITPLLPFCKYFGEPFPILFYPSQSLQSDICRWLRNERDFIANISTYILYKYAIHKKSFEKKKYVDEIFDLRHKINNK